MARLADDAGEKAGNPYLEDSARLLFSVAIMIWALGCTKVWRRQRAVWASRWVAGSLLDDPLPWLLATQAFEERPEFRGELRLSPITGLPERHYPAHRRRWLYALTGSLTLACLLMAIVVNLCLLNVEAS
ncbi:unnamed protein product [Protopolystoma xenopodis]|uniref:Anoctamin n=1 Tax=Protopolystoma xenopodis TaxID=117903 RepID=A0A3S5CGL3_9PLAT|nr:unnamed protein product [Protopolystoma xenopodis]